MMRLSLDTEAASMVIILTFKWFATANLLNACLRVGTSADRSAFTLRSGLRLS